jgi:beta-phosphoglucomutase-like phosphatase (HAD superfamily)
MPGKRVQFDDETWAALDMLARDRMMDFQELADEAFRDVLKKHGRPSSLREALRRSAGETAEIVPFRRKAAKKARVRKRRR